MDNKFEALQDLYDIIEKCERRNVKLPEDVIRQINVWVIGTGTLVHPF